MATPRAPAPVALTVILAAALVSAWWWRSRIFRAPRPPSGGESWDQVKEEYPPIEEPAAIPQLSPDAVAAILQANPFSAQRRLVPPPADGAAAGGTGSEPRQPAGPQFAYKGRINLGKRQRAIVEDLQAHKTHFLEVGQEVAGFKVLDITENRVVLSDTVSKQDVVVPLATTVGP